MNEEKLVDPVEEVETIQEDDQEELQTFDDYLLDVIETNTDVNSNLDTTNKELTDVTEQLETLLKVFEAQAKESEEKQVKDTLTRENDLKFREKLLQEITGDESQQDLQTLESIDHSLQLLVENSQVNKTTDLTVMIYGLIIIPFILICIVLWKAIKSFI